MDSSDHSLLDASISQKDTEPENVFIPSNLNSIPSTPSIFDNLLTTSQRFISTPNRAPSSASRNISNINSALSAPLRADLGRTSLPINRSLSNKYTVNSSSRVVVPDTPMEGLIYSPAVNRNELIGRQGYADLQQINILDDEIADGNHQEDDDHLELFTSPQTLIWGTEINVTTCLNVFRNFLTFFSDETGAESKPPLYSDILDKLAQGIESQALLNINCAHLKSFPPTRVFYHQLLQFPQEIIPILDHVVNEEVDFRGGLRGAGPGTLRVQVRTFGTGESTRMRALNPSDIEQLLSIRGMVVRVSAVVPDLKQAFFRCCSCFAGVDVVIDRGKIEEPTSCSQCQRAGTMEIIHNRSIFADKQLIRLQETPEEIPEGETPHTITVFAFDDLVDSVRPGDRVEVTGILRAVAKRTNPRLRTVRSVFKTYIDAIHFLPLGNNSSGQSGKEKNADANTSDFNTSTEFENNQTKNELSWSRDRIRSFLAFSESGNVYEKLVKSFAPSVWEMEDVKKGLLCLLFGGTIRRSRVRAQFDDKTGVLDPDNLRSSETLDETKENVEIHQRGDINILLCGDPGTSKSQLLSYVHNLTPRGIYTSGKGSSAVGLTASVVRDAETKDMVLESGALVLSDNGVCCIDEFDKMSDQTRAILHEAMEQQTVSITKAGIIATLNARTSILASANPVQSRYNPRLSVVENIKLPPTLLSRFDLIYLILDKPNSDSDRRLAQHLVSLYFPDKNINQAPKQTGDGDLSNHEVVDQTFLSDYIAFSRENVFPEISETAQELLVRNYLELRSLGGRGTKTITATPRQLESLIRLSEALAKMRLCPFVNESDVKEATRLMKVATQTAATDPRTGTIDMDMISTGRTALDRDLVFQLSQELRNLLEISFNNGQRVSLGQLRQQLLQNIRASSGSALPSSIPDIEEAVRELETDGFLQYIERTQTIIVRK